MNINKLQARILILIFLIGGMFKGTIQAQNDTLKLLHITDLHLLFNLDNYGSDIANHRKITRGYKNSNDNFRQFINTIPEKTNSNFVVATGDLVDFYDSETPGGERQAGQIEMYTRLTSEYYFPMFLTLGNHDVFSYNWGDNKVIPNQLSSARSKTTWIRNFDCFRDGTYYSRTYKLGKTTYRLIFLDNSYYMFPKEEQVVPPYVDKPQLHWLRTELNKAEDDIEIILMHIPFSDASVLPESHNELYAELQQYPSVKLVLAGHKHRNAIMQFSSVEGQQMVQVETSSLATEADSWRLIQLTEKNISISLPGRTDKELIISLN